MMCQYARAQFDAAVIKDVIATHPLLIYGGHVYQNRYYIPPDEVLLHKDPGRKRPAHAGDYRQGRFG